MFNKIFDESQLVVFDEKGNIVENPGHKSSQDQKLEKDPDATMMFETYKLIDRKIKFVWYATPTNRQRTLFLGTLVALFFMLVWAIKADVKKSNEKYNKAVQERTARGCKYPTMVVQGPREGHAVDPDEGCSPK